MASGGWYAYGWSSPGLNSADTCIEGVDEESARNAWHFLAKTACRAVLLHEGTVKRDWKREDYIEPHSSPVRTIRL